MKLTSAKRARHLLGRTRRWFLRWLAGGTSTLRGSGIALTFDDGPHPEVTPRLLDLLAAHGARASFFVIGEHVERNPDLVRRMVREGHTVGAHSMHHPDFAKIPVRDARNDTIEVLDLVARVTGERTGLFRPPKGHLTIRTALMLRRLGVKTWFWDHDSGDWRTEATVESVVERSLGARKGGVVLMHDTSVMALEATRLLLVEPGEPPLEFVAL